MKSIKASVTVQVIFLDVGSRDPGFSPQGLTEDDGYARHSKQGCCPKYQCVLFPATSSRPGQRGLKKSGLENIVLWLIKSASAKSESEILVEMSGSLSGVESAQEELEILHNVENKTHSSTAVTEESPRSWWKRLQHRR